MVERQDADARATQRPDRGQAVDPADVDHGGRSVALAVHLAQGVERLDVLGARFPIRS